jgi:ATP-binding protein involved in chromosome partitioning
MVGTRTLPTLPYADKLLAMINESAIRARLAHYRDPYLGQDLLTTKAVKRIDIRDDSADVFIRLGYPIEQRKTEITKALQAELAGLKINVHLDWQVAAHAVQAGQTGLPQIKNIIAVGSGKGGVGKSTTAVNLALALAQEGARVGLLDADIYGPNQPLILGINEKPAGVAEKKLKPIIKYDLQSMSIGYLIGADTPMIWRGPMISQAVTQLLFDTQWDALDYLFIDLPPGTGDIPLTLAKKVPVAGAVIVTTPQEISLMDARKALEMFTKLGITVLGVVENMSTHVCSHCGHEEPIFGAGGGEKLADKYQVSVLGQMPLDKNIRQDTDRGCPTLVADPEGASAQRYREIARLLAAKLSLQPINYAAKFPQIVVENK